VGNYDSVIEVSLLEHWHNVFNGLAQWNLPNYFFPNHDVLGYNDGYFIYGIFYSMIRSFFGLDPFASSELVNMLVKNIGFISFFLVCTRIFVSPVGLSCFGALIFTLSNNSYAHSGHQQLLSVSFAPVMALLLWESWRSFVLSRIGRFTVFGSSAGIFLSAWLLTAFYMAWFFIFYFTFLIVVILVMSKKASITYVFAHIKLNAGAITIVTVVSVISVIPFVIVYMQKALETGMHSFGVTLSYVPHIYDIVNVGPNNILFGPIYGDIVTTICHNCDVTFHELTTGITPFLMILFGYCCIKMFKSSEHINNRELLTGMLITTIFTWGLSLQSNGVTGWYFVYHFFPGAKAVRVVSRYQIFLTAPIIVLVVTNSVDLIKKMPWFVKMIVVCFFIVENMNTGSVGLNRQSMIHKTLVTAPAPKECKSFFALPAVFSTEKDVNGALYPNNVVPMMIAELNHIPTINGVASFLPPLWSLSQQDRMDYLNHVDTYIYQQDLSNVCMLDLGTKQWQTAWDQFENTDAPICHQSVNFTTPTEMSSQFLQGFAGVESIGRWSGGKRGSFICKIVGEQHFNKVMLTTHGYTPQKLIQHVQISINDGQYIEFTYSNDKPDNIIVLDLPKDGNDFVKILFKFPDAVSPKMMKDGADFRSLAISVKSIEFN
jgi:hypothetical protein